MTTPMYLTPAEVAEMRRRTEDALAQERHRNTGPPFIRDGGRILYPAEELEAWLAERLVIPEP